MLSYDRERLEQMLWLFASIGEEVTVDGVQEQIGIIKAELARRDRAEALPHIPFGKTITITEELPPTPVAAMPAVGLTGMSLGKGDFPGTTAVQFLQSDLYGPQDDEPDRKAVLFIPNYALAQV